MTDVETSTAGAAAPEPAPHPLHALVDRWLADTMHNSVVARSTETWNHVHAAAEDLKRRLVEGESK